MGNLMSSILASSSSDTILALLKNSSPTTLMATTTTTIAGSILLYRQRRSIQKYVFEDLMLYILTNHRSAFVTVFGLPLSLLFDGVLRVRSKYISTFRSAPHLHDERVRTIQQQVQTLRADNASAPLCTARPGWMSISLSYRTYKKKWNAVEMPLYDILSLDLQERVVHVEPFVSIGQLTHALNPKGYTLPVVPEMDDLTVGGLINGTGIESSSHRYGLFHEIISELELLLGDGTVVIATADNEYSDLFHAIPWSYGTLALLLSAKLKLIPCKKFVKLTYTPHYTKDSYIEHMRQLSGEYQEEQGKEEKTPMFVEGLAYSLNEGVVMAGDFVDASEVPRGCANRLSLWWKPWFYKHVQTILGKKKQKVEYIPLRDYYHRHSQSLFWEMELMIPIGNNPIFRWTLGWLMPPKVSFLKLSQTEMTRKLTEETHVAQDFLVPTRNMGKFLTICDKEFDQVYPLWLCLHSHKSMPGSLLKDPALPGAKEEMYVDIGVYGLPKCVQQQHPEQFDMKRSMRNALFALQTMDGFQMLYADVFFTRAEFEQMFRHGPYRQLRNKYKADTGAFKEVYDKMSVVL